MQFGTVIALPLSGYLCDMDEWDNGWPMAFYVPGAIAICWCLSWIFLAYDGPEFHPRIADDEKMYIVRTTGRLEGKDGKEASVIQYHHDFIRDNDNLKSYNKGVVTDSCSSWP